MTDGLMSKRRMRVLMELVMLTNVVQCYLSYTIDRIGTGLSKKKKVYIAGSLINSS